MNNENPPLHPVRTTRIPTHSWIPSAVERLPKGWVNVRIYSYDRTLGRDLYVTEDCPAVLHMESTVTENVVQLADDDGELFHPEFGDPYDDHPVVVDVVVADPPHRWHHHLDPDYKPAYMDGGYLGSCPADLVRKLLEENGFADAVVKPEGWVDPDGD